MTRILESGKVSGYAIVWGSHDNPDLQGEYFTPETELNIPDELALYIGEPLPENRIGTAKIQPDGHGVYVSGQIEPHINKFGVNIPVGYYHALQDILHLASIGSKSEVSDNGRINKFPIMGIVLTATPVQPPQGDEINDKEIIDNE